MNKSLLSFLLVLLPFVSQAQSSPAKPQAFQREVGINLGHAPDNAYHRETDFGHGGYIRSSLSLLKNRGDIQYGFTIEGGTNSNDQWYVSPGLLANYKFSSNKAYFYAGAMAGYICSRDMIRISSSKNNMAQGYSFGLQGGFVKPMGKRISLTTELAVRSTQLWQKVRAVQYFGSMGEGKDITEQSTIIYFPVALGLRYNI